MNSADSDINDIQFLGNWNSQQSSSASSFVSAIVLAPVDPQASPMDTARTFSRNLTSVVHVGRVVPTDPAVPTDDRATFISPVMSRNHAKITFADSGSVFIIDTGSHHGTWVARPPGQFKLAPESPLQLQDGDRLTFGKDVHRNGTLHKPLTVSVKLLRSPSTPSSMSISSDSVTPPNKITSPKPRNRFGLNSPSDSDASDSEKPQEIDPRTGANAIPINLPVRRSEDYTRTSSSPKSPMAAALSQSEPGSPANKKHTLNVTQDSPMHFSEISCDSPMSPTGPPGLFPGLASSLDLEGIDMLPEAADQATSSSPVDKESTPPWRRFSEIPAWPSINTTIMNRMPDFFQQPPRKIGRLLNPLWLRKYKGRAGEEIGEQPGSLSMFQNGVEAVGLSHSGHGPYHRSLEDAPTHELHGQGDERRGDRLDEDWGLYGQFGVSAKNEIELLGERLEGLRKDVDELKMRGEEGTELCSSLSSRIDDLSDELKNKLAADAKTSQQALFAEHAGLNALKDSITALRNDISVLKSHKSAMQTDIRFLRVNHEELRGDFTTFKDESLTHATSTRGIMEEVHSTHEDANELKDGLALLQDQARSFKNDFESASDRLVELEGNMKALQGDFLSVEALTQRINGDVRGLSTAHIIADQEMSTRIRDQVRSEMKALIEESRELSQIIGKRKRADDDELVEAAVDATNPTPDPITSRPRKRIRIVLDCAAAGALGAVSAWLGLAFL